MTPPTKTRPLAIINYNAVTNRVTTIRHSTRGHSHDTNRAYTPTTTSTRRLTQAANRATVAGYYIRATHYGWYLIR